MGALTAGAGLNAIGIAIRCKPSGRAELGIAASIVFYAMLSAPVLGLGLVERLTAFNLAVVSSAVFGVTFWTLVRGGSARRHLAECGRAAVDLLALPVRALVEAARARSVVVLGLVASYAIIGYAFVFAILAPVSWWDSAIYHEPIIGFAIQNHGFGIVTLPPEAMAQSIDSFPRVCEATSTWFAILTDRTLVELPNVLAAPALMLTVYAMAQQGGGERMASMGWAAVVLLMPQTRSQLARVYVDVQLGFFAVAGLYFATRPRSRIRDAACATVALMLFVGTKFSALTLGPPVVLVVVARVLIAHVRTRRAAALAAAAGSGLCVAGMALIFPLRNWKVFHNPVWPVAYENKRLGLHWHGVMTLDEMVKRPALRTILAQMYEPAGKGIRDVMDRGYGYAVPWVLFPLAALAFAVATVVVALALVRTREPPPRLAWLGWVLFVVAAWTLGAPAPTGQEARYNINLVAGSTFLVAWLLDGSAWRRVREGVMGAAIALSIIPIFWEGDYLWSWGITNDPAAIFRHPFAHPAYVDEPTFDLLGKERAAEIGPGDRVAFDDHISFLALLWNFDFSNSIKYIPFKSEKDYVAAIDGYDPKWVVTGGDAPRDLLEKHGWERVGKLEDHQVLRRAAPH